MTRPIIVLSVLWLGCASDWNAPLKPKREPGALCGRAFEYCGPDTDGSALCCGPGLTCEGCAKGYCCPRPTDGSESAFGGFVGAKRPVKAMRVQP